MSKGSTYNGNEVGTQSSPQSRPHPSNMRSLFSSRPSPSPLFHPLPLSLLPPVRPPHYLKDHLIGKAEDAWIDGL